MKTMTMNVKARRYIYLHMMFAVFIVSWPFFPFYLFTLHFTLIEVGILFSVAGVAEVVFTYFAGRLMDKIPCNYGLALIELFGSISNVIYGVSQNFYHILTGKLVEKMGWVFNPSYTVYENEAYKEDYETLYHYHVMAPEITQVIAFPLFGFLLTYVFTSQHAYRSFFVLLGITDMVLILYVLKVLPRVGPAPLKTFQFSLPRGLYAIVAAEVLLVFGGSVGSQFVLVYYILEALHGTFFTVTMVEAVVSVAIILTILVSLRRNMETIPAARYGILLMMVYAALMTWAPAVWVILLAYFIESVGNALWFPRHRTLMMKQIPEERRGEILGGIQSLNKLVSIAAPFCAAFVAVRVYILAPFAIQLASLVGVYLIYGWIRKTQNVS